MFNFKTVFFIDNLPLNKFDSQEISPKIDKFIKIFEE